MEKACLNLANIELIIVLMIYNLEIVQIKK